MEPIDKLPVLMIDMREASISLGQQSSYPTLMLYEGDDVVEAVKTYRHLWDLSDTATMNLLELAAFKVQQI